MNRSARVQLTLAALAVAFAAADTYVVVLALPDMMTTVGISLDHVQRAAPIISGFLLGYVAILPLIGRISDLRGRRPVLVASLIIFAFGSLTTALSTDLSALVSGRFLQGVGAGGLVPATLALVADLYPVERRAVPLGIVSAVQEIGAVIGPIFGAVILAVADWEAIFWVNLAVGLALAALLGATAGESGEKPPSAKAQADFVGFVLVLLALSGLILTLAQPPALVTQVTLGWPFVPLTGSSLWLAPLTMATCLFAVLAAVRFWFAARPLIDLRGWVHSAIDADLIGAGLLGAALAGIIFAFATADPAQATLSGHAGWWLGGSAVAFLGFVVRLRLAQAPLIPPGAFSQRPAWASLLANFLVGCALIAALVEIPTFARLTEYPDSQLGASMVLLRLLIAVPIGAVVGGLLTKRWSTGVVAAVAMVAVGVANLLFSRWDAASLGSGWATLPLLLGGFGFGLALAPLNSALLAATDAAVHGLASALAVVARMVGMLVGVSVLTEIGLHHFYAESAKLPDSCRTLNLSSTCEDLIQGAVISQISVIFIGAAVCAGLAALVSLFGSVRLNATRS